MNLFNGFVIKKYFLIFVFVSANVYSLPCYVVEQEDRRLQNVCDDNVFNSNKINQSSHADF